jgi:hypothetical protein
MTNEQFDTLNGALSSAHALLNSRIVELEVRGSDATMYHDWKEENAAAFEALRDVFVNQSVREMEAANQ